MEEKDLLDLLDSDEKPFEKDDKAISSKGGDKPKRVNLWDKTDFTPKKLILENMNKVGKSYTWYLHLTENSIPEDVKKKILSLVGVLGKKEFTLRIVPDKADSMAAEMMGVEDCKSLETYLPWKKFNEGIETPTLAWPKSIGYEIAIAYNKNFVKLPAALRAIYAARSHTLVGENGDNQVDFFICYTEGGAEGFKKGYDYKKEGSLGFYISICNELNIPIFNLKNDESFKRLVKLLA